MKRSAVKNREIASGSGRLPVCGLVKVRSWLAGSSSRDGIIVGAGIRRKGGARAGLEKAGEPVEEVTHHIAGGPSRDWRGVDPGRGVGHPLDERAEAAGDLAVLLSRGLMVLHGGFSFVAM